MREGKVYGRTDGQDPARGGQITRGGSGQEARDQRRDDLRLAQTLRQLDAENSRHKKMLAERVMDIEILKEVAANNGERASLMTADRFRVPTRSIDPTSVRAAERGEIYGRISVPHAGT